MLQGYRYARMHEMAVFEFFVRNLPTGRGYLVAAGLDQVLSFLESARFTASELDWLRSREQFTPAFVDSLSAFRFTGDVRAMPEGSVFFPHEPILQVIAPISEAQLVETRVINLLQFQVLIAGKAARCKAAAPNSLLVDFGLRRAHGSEAGLLAARAAYIGGFDGTSTVLAGQCFGIPVYGTMAHSFVEAHDDESSAFENFVRAQPVNTVLLIDTYDTERAARRLPGLMAGLREEGYSLSAVRLDSGDLAAHATKVRRILDAGGLDAVRIFASGGLDEYRILKLVRSGAPIDGFGVGSRLDTSADAPYLDCAYKLVEYAGVARRKLSETKSTWPGRKQVYRTRGDNGIVTADCIARAEEHLDGEPLLDLVMRGGRRVERTETIEAARARLRMQIEQLPEAGRQLDALPAVPVRVSDGLRSLAAETDRCIEERLALSEGPAR